MTRKTNSRASHQGVALGFWQKWMLHAVTFLLWLSGALWLVQKTSPLQPLWMRIHGAAAMAFLMTFGALLLRHVPLGWRQERQRPSGAWLLILSGVLIATGWGLYYEVDRQLRDWTAKIHWVLGLLLPAFIILHIWLGRRAEKRSIQ